MKTIVVAIALIFIASPVMAEEMAEEEESGWRTLELWRSDAPIESKVTGTVGTTLTDGTTVVWGGTKLVAEFAWEGTKFTTVAIVGAGTLVAKTPGAVYQFTSDFATWLDGHIAWIDPIEETVANKAYQDDIEHEKLPDLACRNEADESGGGIVNKLEGEPSILYHKERDLESLLTRLHPPCH